MAGILQRPAPAIVAFLAGAGLQLSGIEDFRFAMGLWSFAALWGLLAVVTWEPVRTRMPKLPYTVAIQKKTERQDIIHADLNIVPLAVNGTAMFRVDNEGPRVDVAASVQRIEDWELKTVPYRLVWEPEGSARQNYNITQQVLPIGRVAFALVAESDESKSGEAYFIMPGGHIQGIGSTGEPGTLEVEISVATNPSLRGGRFRSVYLLELDKDSTIIDFREKAD